MLRKLKREIKKQANPEKAKQLQRFFKTGIGQYGEGDVFLGLTVPIQREIAKEFGGEVSFNEIEELLNSGIHEERLISLLILVDRFRKGEDKDKKYIFDFYLRNASRVNNWDLVDLTAPNIVGYFLLDKNRKILRGLAVSDSLWERRIAIVSCFAFIRNNEFDDCLKISEMLLEDSHDLIHKAVGWMLREVGKKDRAVLEGFLKKHYKSMPRTMLRYSIERFEEGLRKSYLLGEI